MKLWTNHTDITTLSCKSSIWKIEKKRTVTEETDKKNRWSISDSLDKATVTNCSE